MEKWVRSSPDNFKLLNELIFENKNDIFLSEWKAAEAENSLKKLRFKISKKNKIKLYNKISVAASFLLFLIFSIYFLTLKKRHFQNVAQNHNQNDFKPADNKTILKTGHGQIFVLKDQKNGALLYNIQNGIVKTDSSSISYLNKNSSSASSGQPMVYDTLSNPAGSSNYQVTLSDGTVVLLNTATSIRFPENFSGNNRTIELIEGEIFLNVAHDVTKNFNVKIHELTIRDIGTRFDVKAYNNDDEICTTLTQGRVNVIKNNKNTILILGQQASLLKSKNHLIVKKVNTDDMIAWTDNFFYFDHADLKTVMKQIARWYNVEIIYKGNLPKTSITGEMYRNLTASQIFDGLNYLDVHFHIQGNSIIVEGR